MLLKDPAQIGVVLSAVHNNEDNFALARLAIEWKVGHVFVAGRPPVPARADGRLKTADVNPNTAGVKAIAEALGLTTRPAYELEATLGSLRALIALGDVLPGAPTAKLKELELISISAHERGAVPHAKVALPSAAWAECAGTITNAKGMVQRNTRPSRRPAKRSRAGKRSSGSPMRPASSCRGFMRATCSKT